MSDTPTTAEEVIAQSIADWYGSCMGIDGEPTPVDASIAEAIVAALRSSHEALADLNGGEWVRLVDAAEVVAEHHDIALAEDAYDDGINPDVIAALDALGRAVAPFVPREDR